MADTIQVTRFRSSKKVFCSLAIKKGLCTTNYIELTRKQAETVKELLRIELEKD